MPSAELARPDLPGPQEGESAKRTFRVGTLTYSLPALLILLGWLLIADFCFSLMEAVTPTVLPLMLGQLDSPNWLIVLFITTIPGIFNATVCPVVSYWSDRHRGPLGRRMPFILFTLPFLCGFLALIGLAPWLAQMAAERGWITDPRIATLALLGVFITAFQFFNMFVASVFYYLFNDVVPAEFMGRFLAVFRFVGAIAGSAFYFWIFPHAETHFAIIFVGAALLYGIMFLWMSRHVREGEYPPPPPLMAGSTVFAGVKTFFAESFRHRFYWYYYLFAAFWAVAVNASIFQIFFARSVGLSLEQFGQFAGTAGLIGAALLLPCGILSDKFSPMRTLMLAAVMQTILTALPLVFLLYPVPPQQAFQVWCVVFGLSLPVSALFVASELPACMQLLPRHRFGQFSASTALVRSLIVIVAGQLCGFWMDWLKAGHAEPMMAYRYLPLWPTLFQGMATFFLWCIYREWKQRGGRGGYTPPEV